MTILLKSKLRLSPSISFPGARVQKDMKKIEMTMLNAINNAMDIAMTSNKKTLIFGEDVAFGGVFKCTDKLAQKYGKDRVFNTPLSEQGIAGFAAGVATQGYDVIAEIQFADYIFPAFDQIVNEIAKYRYRTSGELHVGGLTIRAPCGAVGHGGLYHSQSVESFFAHCPGLVVVSPRGPRQAKGLLLSAIRSRDPVLFFEPKILYRQSIGLVEEGDFEIPLGKADVVKTGSDLTLIGWGNQVNRLESVAMKLAGEIDCEVIDLQTIVPYDLPTIIKSVEKTKRVIISSEAPITNNFVSELSSLIYENSFDVLLAPVRRLCGYDTPFPLAFEEFYLPNEIKIEGAIRDILKY